MIPFYSLTTCDLLKSRDCLGTLQSMETSAAKSSNSVKSWAPNLIPQLETWIPLPWRRKRTAMSSTVSYFSISLCCTKFGSIGKRITKYKNKLAPYEFIFTFLITCPLSSAKDICMTRNSSWQIFFHYLSYERKLIQL